MTFGVNLKTLRADKGLTQKELAKRAKVELAQISRIETGSSQPKLETIKNLCLGLKCSADELIFGPNEVRIQNMDFNTAEMIEKLRPLQKACLLFIINSYCENEFNKEKNSAMEDMIKDKFFEEMEIDEDLESIKMSEIYKRGYPR